MNIYNKDAKCPKCGCTHIDDTYHAKGDPWYDEDSYFSRHPKEVITRACINCKFRWHEKPLDKETK